jgi:2-polyprenyl-6-methoxyphenol hydroxylase-like FAD-dependent oxidoreductase
MKLNPLLLSQSVAESFMRKHLFDRFGICVELGTEVISFEQDNNTVTAHLTKRIDSQSSEVIHETLTIPYLVGCDGGKS